jgi:hypothetical protein
MAGPDTLRAYLAGRPVPFPFEYPGRAKLKRPALGVVAVLLAILDRAHSRLISVLSP